jgi:hypothetical protein
VSLVDDLARIDGVIAVDGRAMKAGLMEVPRLLRPATAHLIALPDDDRRALNRIVLVAGRLPDPNRTDEAVALKTFLDAAHVSLGERLSMVIGRRRLSFTIVGSALSPEYVYAPSNGPMPDDAHHGVFWAPRGAVERPTRSAVAAVLTTEMAFFLGFAAAIAFGVAYNISRIALADRARDLATLRVLGFGRAECAYILSELGLLALAATPLGVLGSFALADALITAFTRQDFYLPFHITAKGLGVAFTTYLSAVILAAALVAQRIWRFDLVAVLKTRD